MKKILSIIMSLLIVSCLFACSLPEESPTSMDNASGDSAPTDNVPEIDTVLVDSEKIKAIYIGAKDESALGVFYVTLKIENKAESDIVINLEDADVDGETIPLITTGVPLVIRPGNSGQTAFIFSMVNLSISSMDDANSATFKIVARDNDSFDTVYESEVVTVNLH